MLVTTMKKIKVDFLSRLCTEEQILDYLSTIEINGMKWTNPKIRAIKQTPCRTYVYFDPPSHKGVVLLYGKETKNVHE